MRQLNESSAAVMEAQSVSAELDFYVLQDYQRILFGSRRAGEIRADIAKLLVLPIDVRDVIRMRLDENCNVSQVRYARAVGMYNIDKNVQNGQKL